MCVSVHRHLTSHTVLIHGQQPVQQRSPNIHIFSLKHAPASTWAQHLEAIWNSKVMNFKYFSIFWHKFGEPRFTQKMRHWRWWGHLFVVRTSMLEWIIVFLTLLHTCPWMTKKSETSADLGGHKSSQQESESLQIWNPHSTRTNCTCKVCQEVPVSYSCWFFLLTPSEGVFPNLDSLVILLKDSHVLGSIKSPVIYICLIPKYQ